MMGGKSSPTARPRPGGGMNQGLGQFGEHLDEAAMAQAAKQQQMTQVGSNPLGQAGTAQSSQSSQQSHGNQLAPQSLKQALVVEPVKDVVQGLLDASGLGFLGISIRKEKDQEEEAKKKRIAERYKQLNEEQQAYARQRYEQEMARKQQEEEERMQKKQAEEEAQAAELVMPSTLAKGHPVGPASGMSGRQKATTQLQMNRQRMSQGD